MEGKKKTGKRCKRRCSTCSQVYPLEKFVSKWTGKLTNWCAYCQALNPEDQEKRKKALFAHLWIRSDGSEITDPWEVVDDGQKHKCRICKRLKDVKEFNLGGGKLNPRLTKGCSQCLETLRLRLLLKQSQMPTKPHQNLFDDDGWSSEDDW